MWSPFSLSTLSRSGGTVNTRRTRHEIYIYIPLTFSRRLVFCVIRVWFNNDAGRSFYDDLLRTRRIARSPFARNAEIIYRRAWNVSRELSPPTSAASCALTTIHSGQPREPGRHVRYVFLWPVRRKTRVLYGTRTRGQHSAISVCTIDNSSLQSSRRA